MNASSPLPAAVIGGSRRQMTTTMTSKNSSNNNDDAFVKQENHDAIIAECRQQLFDSFYLYPEKECGGDQDSPPRKESATKQQQQQQQQQRFLYGYLVEKDHGDMLMKKRSSSGSSSSISSFKGISEQSPSSSTKPSVETDETIIAAAEPEFLSWSRSKPSPQQERANEDEDDDDGSDQVVSNSSSPPYNADAPSDECSSPLQKETAKNRRILFPNKTTTLPPTRSRTNTDEQVVVADDHDDENDDAGYGSFYDSFAICCDMSDMSSVFSEITLDAIFGWTIPSPPVLPPPPVEAEKKIETGDVWAIELLDGKHQKGDTLWFRLTGHHSYADEAVHLKDLEGIEVLDYVHAVTKVQESAVFYILKDNGESMWVESDWVKDAMVDILLQSKRDETITIPTLRSLRKKNKNKGKKRWFPWSRSFRSL